jgi:fatty acyl-CoA reductase
MVMSARFKMNVPTSTSSSPVADFFAGRSVLVTGATGFVGKVVVHRLLTACSRVERIYVLMRHKRGKTPDQRLDGLLAAPIFDDLSKSLKAKVRKEVNCIKDMHASIIQME